MDLASLRRWWPPVAVAALIALVALAAARSRPQLDRSEPRIDIRPDFAEYDRPAGDAPPTRAADLAAGDSGLPGWVGTAVLWLLVALVLAVVVVVARTVVRDLLRRRSDPGVPRRAGGPRPDPADEVVAALDAGLSDLSDTDRDPRRAVIACWVRLEQAAAAAGTARRPGDSPSDLVGRLLREQRVSADVLGGFAQVYREARYATHTVDERMRVEARAALQRLRADLTGAPVG